MDLQSFDQLEKRIEELTQRFVALKEEHQRTLQELSLKEKQIEELSGKISEFDRTKAQVHSRIESILKRLELLQSQSGL